MFVRQLVLMHLMELHHSKQSIQQITLISHTKLQVLVNMHSMVVQDLLVNLDLLKTQVQINLLLESMATSIGISVSTLASYISDGGNRTAREVSAEESSTTLFVENARRRMEAPINKLLGAVLRFYGYIDDVEIRWSRAGMTNITVLVDTLTKAVNGGLISKEAAHHAYNFDNDEEQNAEDFAKVQADAEKEKQTLFGGDMM